MFTIDKNFEIAAPASVVWEVLTDFARYGEWNPFVPECKAELAPGGAIDMQVRLMSKPQFQREWIRTVESGKGFSYSMKPMPLGALRSLRSHAIEEVNAERCRYRSHFEMEGWLLPLILAMFRGGLERGFQGMSSGVKTRAEALWLARRSRTAA